MKSTLPSDILSLMENKGEGHGALRVGVIDIGTNSVRLLVADFGHDEGFQRVFEDRRITRLGEGSQNSGRLSEEAIQRTLETLCVFLVKAQEKGAARVLGAATSAVREASNGQLFAERARELTGLEIRVLSGNEEAGWMARGISLLWAFAPERWIALDIGGGSTEFALMERDVFREAFSIRLGMVHLTEDLLTRDPPSSFQMERCRNVSKEAIIEALRICALQRDLPTLIVGTAGTITCLAAMEMNMDPYDSERVNGYRLSLEAVDRWCMLLAGLNKRKRCEIPGMEPGREDVILAGTVILCEFMRALGSEEIVVSDYGLLEGIALMAARPAFETTTGPLWTNVPD